MKGTSVKPDPFGTNSKIPSEEWQHEMHVESKARRRLSVSLDRGHEGHIREGCFKKMAIQVCTNHDHVFIPV
jgi:hypothetical protein